MHGNSLAARGKIRSHYANAAPEIEDCHCSIFYIFRVELSFPGGYRSPTSLPASWFETLMAISPPHCGSGEMSPAEFTAFLQSVFGHLAAFSVDGAIHFQCIDWTISRRS
jgi:hypothetical protein